MKVQPVKTYLEALFSPTPPYQTTRKPKLKLSSNSANCGVRSSSYLPHLPSQHNLVTDPRIPRRRRGRIVWGRNDTMGSFPAPRGSFPWMASLFVLYNSGEALFMCAATIVNQHILLTAAHCFTNNKTPETWFARVGDNFILHHDPSEQTFRVKEIIIHENFDPLKDNGGDGRHDIALVILRPHTNGAVIKYNQDVGPICFPKSEFPLANLYVNHCEIAGWGMTEYNNTSSYPDSVRGARIQVGDVPKSYCNHLYQRNVQETGKFCAGGQVDACQEDSGGPLVCRLDDQRYYIIGIVSSGKGCGVYPGLYTEVSKYSNWVMNWVNEITSCI
eukprot:TCALIF_08238-PA protein Name:"Similar to PRSS12 Neurotrypsin (Pan troglodytes)" AED:0.04 eAED:0.04 QI:81/0/0.33/0.66/0/0/3/0/330